MHLRIGSLKRKKQTDLQPDSSRRRKRAQIKSKMKEKKSQPTPQKYKGSQRLLQTIICQQNGQPEEMDKFHFIQYPKNKSGRSREYEQTDYK